MLLIRVRHSNVVMVHSSVVDPDSDLDPAFYLSGDPDPGTEKYTVLKEGNR